VLPWLGFIGDVRIPIIFWIAIILVIIAIAVVSTTIQRVKNK